MDTGTGTCIIFFIQNSYSSDQNNAVLRIFTKKSIVVEENADYKTITKTIDISKGYFLNFIS